MTDFAEWLQFELDARGWAQIELTRRGGISSGAISKIMSGERKPGPDVCNAIAKALKIRPEIVFRSAGLLPHLPDDDPLTAEAEYLLSQLPEDKRQQAIDFIRFLAGEGDKKIASRRVERPGPGTP
jgi:transcriptional regulator with XRE-family HTH domain